MKRSRWGSSFGARESFKGVGAPTLPSPFQGEGFFAHTTSHSRGAMRARGLPRHGEEP